MRYRYKRDCFWGDWKNNRTILITELVTFIQNNLKYYTVIQFCTALKFPRSTYYKALLFVPSNRKKEFEAFGRQVKKTFEESKRLYGSVKICRSLNDNGIRVA